jgi:hypothetical protein
MSVGRFRIFILSLACIASQAVWPHPDDEVSFSACRSNMACFPPVSLMQLDAKEREHGIRFDGGTPEYQTAVMRVMDRIKYLGARLAGTVDVQFVSGKSYGSRCASYTPGGIVLAVCGRDAETMAKHFAHEMGHVFGQRGFYNSYFKNNAVCRITGYSTNNANSSPRNEEFAEVFASYLGSPDVLRHRCPAQYQWMHDNVFSNAVDPTADCAANPNPGQCSSGAAPYQWPDEDFYSPYGSNTTTNGLMRNLLPFLQALYNQSNPPVTMPYYPPQNYTLPTTIQTVTPPKGPPVHPWANESIPASR